jgi:hypothetical protein
MQVGRTKYATEFKSVAVKQVIDKGHAAAYAAATLPTTGGRA